MKSHPFFSVLLVLSGSVFAAISDLRSQEAVELQNAPGQHEYVETFNSLPATGEKSWGNGVTLPGWHVAFALRGGELTGLSASSTTRSVMATSVQSFGSDGSDDRALGFMPISATPREEREPGLGAMAAGLVLHNPGPKDIIIDSISYTASQWRLSQSPNPTQWEVSYRVTAAPDPLPIANDRQFTELKDLNWSTPKVKGERAGALDGRAQENSQSLSTEESIHLSAGEYLTIRWRAAGPFGHGVGLDDVKINYTVK